MSNFTDNYFTKGIVLLPLVFAALYLYQIANIKIEAKLQHQIATNQRATIFSIKRLLFELVYMLFVFTLGIAGDKLGVLKILVFSGGFIVLALFVFTLIEKAMNKSNFCNY